LSPRAWTITIQFRPLIVLRNALALAALAAVFLHPAPTAADEMLPTPPAIIAHERAHGAIESILESRSALDPRRRAALSSVILEEGTRAGFDPLFIVAIIESESGFDHEAVSPTGARGLMQVLPSTWREEAPRVGRGRLETFNPVDNARVGISYLARLARSFTRPQSLLLAYNQGPGGASDIITGRAQPTAEAAGYASRVLRAYRRLLSEHGFDGRFVRRYWRAPHLTLLIAPSAPGQSTLASR
jgi:soluble lytic murein transglycosylase